MTDDRGVFERWTRKRDQEEREMRSSREGVASDSCLVVRLTEPWRVYLKDEQQIKFKVKGIRVRVGLVQGSIRL